MKVFTYKVWMDHEAWLTGIKEVEATAINWKKVPEKTWENPLARLNEENNIKMLSKNTLHSQ